MTHSSTSTPLSSIHAKERILILDILRGIALLGILMMNIPGFGLAGDPVVLQETGTINFNVWYFINWFFEGSQRAIFSMLFGCGVLVFTGRLEKKVGGMMTAELHIRRQLWLLVFGLINAFILLWAGDILYLYAICGIILFAFRRASPAFLLGAALFSLVMVTARENRDLYLRKDKIAKGEIVAALDTTKIKLTDTQKDELAAMTGMREKNSLQGRKKQLEKDNKAMQGTFGETYAANSDISVRMETTLAYYYFIWDAFVFMFIGMAFFKMGILQGEHPMKTYLVLAIAGLGIGLPISYLRIEPFIVYQFNNFEINKNTFFAFYDISRLFRSVGTFGLIMVVYKTGWFQKFFLLLRPVGEMAFTNYLMQSVICGIIFYGAGFGYFGRLQRYELYLIVGMIWIVQIIYSNIWMRYFCFGPMEWLWRSLTYWKRQPFRKEVAEPMLVPA
jgi:uncharacterized protein